MRASSGRLAKLTIPLLAAAAIDDGMRQGDGGKVLMLTLAILAVGVVQAVATGLRRYAAFRIALRTETDLRQRLFAHLQRLHFAFHDQSQTGQLRPRNAPTNTVPRGMDQPLPFTSRVSSSRTKPPDRKV